MENVIDLLLLQHDEVRNVVLDEPVIGIPVEVRNIGEISSNQIVDPDDLMTFRQQSVG